MPNNKLPGALESDDHGPISETKMKIYSAQEWVNKIPDSDFLEGAFSRLFLLMAEDCEFLGAFEAELVVQSHDDLFFQKLEESRQKVADDVSKLLGLSVDHSARNLSFSERRKYFLTPQQRGKIIMKVFREYSEFSARFGEKIREEIEIMRKERIVSIAFSDGLQKRLALHILPEDPEE